MSSGDSTVLFRALPKHVRLSASEKRVLKTFAANLTARVTGNRLFTCLITNDAELRSLNNSFLGKDYATDVLSFPSPQGPELGELAISTERAHEQALEFGYDRLDEIRILMLHGVLHLTGLDHESDGGEMARAEESWRRVFTLPPALIARSLPAEPLSSRLPACPVPVQQT